jgi:hypothetical protein
MRSAAGGPRRIAPKGLAPKGLEVDPQLSQS